MILKMKMKVLEELSKLSVSDRVVDEWKEKNRKIIGFFCSYIPEEIIYAGGMFPYRIKARGCTETASADVYMSHVNCTFSRCCLDLALKGRYKFLDGVVSMNSCDSLRRVYDIWRHAIEMPFFHFISVPHKISDETVNWYRDEISRFKESLERSFGVEITDEHLMDSIRIYNETRNLLRELYMLRKSKNPPITGAEVHDVVVAATSIPKEQYNILLREL